MLYNGDTFEHGGEQFRVTFPPEDYSEAPWEWEDGHGPVSEWTSREKASGERELCSDRHSRRFYDFAEAVKIAKRDGWGLCDADKAKLTSKLGRAPTRKEIITEAVERDFRYLYGWCNDQWEYLCVVVEHLDEDGETTGEEASLGMVESSERSYLDATAYELAAGICDRLNAQRDREATIAAEQMELSRPDMYNT